MQCHLRPSKVSLQLGGKVTLTTFLPTESQRTKARPRQHCAAGASPENARHCSQSDLPQ